MTFSVLVCFYTGYFGVLVCSLSRHALPPLRTPAHPRRVAGVSAFEAAYAAAANDFPRGPAAVRFGPRLAQGRLRQPEEAVGGRPILINTRTSARRPSEINSLTATRQICLNHQTPSQRPSNKPASHESCTDRLHAPGGYMFGTGYKDPRSRQDPK